MFKKKQTFRSEAVTCHFLFAYKYQNWDLTLFRWPKLRLKKVYSNSKIFFLSEILCRNSKVWYIFKKQTNKQTNKQKCWSKKCSFYIVISPLQQKSGEQISFLLMCSPPVSIYLQFAPLLAGVSHICTLTGEKPISHTFLPSNHNSQKS